MDGALWLYIAAFMVMCVVLLISVDSGVQWCAVPGNGMRCSLMYGDVRSLILCDEVCNRLMARVQ